MATSCGLVRLCCMACKKPHCKRGMLGNCHHVIYYGHVFGGLALFAVACRILGAIML